MCCACCVGTKLVENNQSPQRSRTCGRQQESAVGKGDKVPSFIKAVNLWLQTFGKFDSI